MLDLISELFRYQVWADAKMVAAVDREHVPPFPAIEAMFAKSGQMPGIAEVPIDHLLQAVLHSQHHRGQIAHGLRELGAVPPAVDSILWKRKQQ